MKVFGMKALSRKQQYLWIGVIACGALICALVFFFAFKTEETVRPDRRYKTNVTSGSERMDHRKIWAHKINQEHDDLAKRLEKIEQAVLSRSDTNQTLPLTVLQPETPSMVASSSPMIENPTAAPLSSVVPQLEGSPISQETSSEKKRPHTRGIQHTALNLPKKVKPLKTGDNTLPAGAFAEAVLLGGVDASTSIQASSDPRPVLLRLTNPGTLPRRFQSDLCGCHVLAACYGDISSERVFMRLEKITCTERKTGEIVEMNVKGYVAGEDGRAGLRGTVVDRAGESVRNAAVGGFIGGVAGFIGQANQNPVTYSLSNGLAQSPSLKGSDMLRQGAAKGAGNALEKYADFYIKRAEQMQPVIQVQAGRIVDIVLTESTPFEDSAERRSLIQINDKKRYENIVLPPETSPNDKEGDPS